MCLQVKPKVNFFSFVKAANLQEAIKCESQRLFSPGDFQNNQEDETAKLFGKCAHSSLSELRNPSLCFLLSFSFILSWLGVLRWFQGYFCHWSEKLSGIVPKQPGNSTKYRIVWNSLKPASVTLSHVSRFVIRCFLKVWRVWSIDPDQTAKYIVITKVPIDFLTNQNPAKFPSGKNWIRTSFAPVECQVGSVSLL